MIRTVLALAATLLLAAGCASALPEPVEFSEPAAGVSREAVLASRWQSYVAWATTEPLQADCRPRLVEAAPGVPYRGTVVLLHGFTACPQQYFELSASLAERGFRSLLVLLPGHGHVYPDVGRDDPVPQPGPWNWKATYEVFARQINGIMQYADGDRVIAGLSGGGSVSLYLNLNARELYDRNLVIAPFLAIAGGNLANTFVAGIGAIPVVNWLDATPFGTEKPCVEKRRQGKAGYCEYQVRHVAGMKSLSRWVRREIRDAPLATQLQIVAVRHDKAVSNKRIAELYELHEANGQVTACAYQSDIPHSMFSRFDNPGIDMYWLDAFLDSAVGFIVDGKPFAVDGTFEADGHVYDQCATALADTAFLFSDSARRAPREGEPGTADQPPAARTRRQHLTELAVPLNSASGYPDAGTATGSASENSMATGRLESIGLSTNTGSAGRQAVKRVARD